eukprot:CAMPEP_0195593248 /NCGR_PEP_ID=MMETSP0815-20121206/783_1 /TAXON_ID=97485 /ORGANISM="Prymnesium parvum, Strain Texoma1" /LENGTH=821 /DNA_ID=CAMNT_0040732375 /DNA_START=189 /DNA_END=2657 /DNA_ORIENTATION=-
MATAPIHAGLATPADYSLAFVTAGGPVAVNASDMRVEVESCHWFVSVAPHELVARGLRHTLSYAQLNELMWCVAECDAGLQTVRFVQVGVELLWMEGLIQACLNAGLARTPLRSWSAVCDALAACARSLSGAAAASRALRSSDLRKLQVGGGRGTHTFTGAAGDPARAAWLEALDVGGVIASCSGSTRILALLERLLAPGAGRWQMSGRDDATGVCAASVFAYPVPGEASPHDIFQWTDASKIEDGPCATIVAIALQATSLAGHGRLAPPGVALGRWKEGPVTAVRSVEGRRFADAAAAADAESQFASLVVRDEAWCRDLRAALEAAAVRALAAQVKGMREYLSDLPVPAQGAPDFSDPAFAKWPLPARLPPPSTACLHSIPPQRDVFGSAGPRWWCSQGGTPGVFNAEGARFAIDICHQARDWCYSAYAARGQPHALRRPPATVLGDGMFESLKTLDGSWAPACVNIWTFDAASGRPLLFDWSLGFRSQFSVEALVDFLGNGDDQLTLATLSRGTLFLVDPPRHMRLLPNQDGYGLHLEALAEDIIKLEAQGFYSVREVLGPRDALSTTSPSPFGYLPGWCTGLSGVDKSTSALEKRRVINKSALRFCPTALPRTYRLVGLSAHEGGHHVLTDHVRGCGAAPAGAAQGFPPFNHRLTVVRSAPSGGLRVRGERTTRGSTVRLAKIARRSTVHSRRRSIFATCSHGKGGSPGARATRVPLEIAARAARPQRSKPVSASEPAQVRAYVSLHGALPLFYMLGVGDSFANTPSCLRACGVSCRHSAGAIAFCASRVRSPVLTSPREKKLAAPGVWVQTPRRLAA